MLQLTERFEHFGSSIAWGALGSGPPLVLLHGTPFSSQVWRKIAPLLARYWIVYFFDLVGYRESEMRAGQDVSLGVQNDLFVAMLERWSLEQPEVLCHDFGGAVHTLLSSEALGVNMKPWQGEIGQSAFYRQIAQMDQRYTDKVESRYGVLDCPVRVLWGEEDEWMPVTQGEKLAGILGNTELVRIPKAGHLLQEDAPEAILAAMLTRPKL